jgi:hypothetical protein
LSALGHQEWKSRLRSFTRSSPPLCRFPRWTHHD